MLLVSLIYHPANVHSTCFERNVAKLEHLAPTFSPLAPLTMQISKREFRGLFFMTKQPCLHGPCPPLFFIFSLATLLLTPLKNPYIHHARGVSGAGRSDMAPTWGEIETGTHRGNISVTFDGLVRHFSCQEGHLFR